MRKPELGKFLLWRLFAGNKAIRSYLPDTRRFHEDTFSDMLGTYGMVYVKPSGGSRGMGVLKVWNEGGRIHVKKTILASRSFASVKEAYRCVNALRGGKAHIVQKGIHLARLNGRPLDIRVMMQRTEPGGAWKHSGMVAKIAGPSSVVTNVALSKGTVMEVHEALMKSLGWTKQQAKRKMKEMEWLAHKSAYHFDTYQKYRELGFDMAVDTQGKLWLIEENTAPSHPLFRKLKSNLSMYRRIEYRWGQYSRALHGRTTAKRSR